MRKLGLAILGVVAGAILVVGVLWLRVHGAVLEPSGRISFIKDES